MKAAQKREDVKLNKVRVSRVEALEKRELMAANLMADLFSNGLLRIEGTEFNDSIVVRQINNQISVDGINIRFNGSNVARVNASLVSNIDVVALGGDDNVWLNSDSVAGQQHLFKPSRIFGGNGNDQLVGGSSADQIVGGIGNDKIWGHFGDDTIWGEDGLDDLHGNSGNDTMFGGNGNDRLWGGDQNDKLYGEGGNDDLMGGFGNDDLYGGNDADRLWGESGNDGLYGGAGTDQMWGGSDSDRFLVMSGSTEHKDAVSTDAVLVFKNGDKNWNASEIEQVDSAFRFLHHKTRNDRLLETSSRGIVTIIRDVGNGTARGTNFNNGTIKMYDGAFSSATQAAQTMLHEMAHNLDTEDSNWNNWLSLSTWRNSAPGSSVAHLYNKSADGQWWYLKTAQFAREYGKHNPREDWATAWESYFKDRHGMATATNVVSLPSSKLAYLDAFFARMS